MDVKAFAVLTASGAIPFGSEGIGGMTPVHVSLRRVDMKQVSQTPQAAALATKPSAAGIENESAECSEGACFIVYVDECALTRECIVHRLASLFPKFFIAALSTPAEGGSVASRLNGLGCVVYYAHSRLIEDAPIIRDLGLLRKALSGVRIVVLSDLEETENVIGAMRLGVAGYLPTSFSVEVASEAIRLVLAGGTFVPASALAFTIDHRPYRTKVPVNNVNGAQASIYFTPRQNQVLRHLWEGEQNKTIAHELRMSEGTVKAHINNIMNKLRVRNRTQVVLTTRQMFDDIKVVEKASNLARRHLTAWTFFLTTSAFLSI